MACETWAEGLGTRHVPVQKLYDFGATEANEKTTRPRTFSPGNFQSRESLDDYVTVIRLLFSFRQTVFWGKRPRFK